MILKFGKFKGQDVYDIPLSYLKWLIENVPLFPSLRYEVIQRLNDESIEYEPLEPKVDYSTGTTARRPHSTTPMQQEIIKAGFRECVKRYHPDMGGTNEEMRLLNEANDALKSLIGVK